MTLSQIQVLASRRLRCHPITLDTYMLTLPSAMNHSELSGLTGWSNGLNAWRKKKTTEETKVLQQTSQQSIPRGS